MIFYTYVWLREDGTPYYVGKGHGNRAYIKGGRRFSPPDPERIRIQNWPDEQTALAMEMYVIDFYGRKNVGTGCLRNLTDGGEGSVGYTHPAKVREKMSISHKGLKEPYETREKKR